MRFLLRPLRRPTEFGALSKALQRARPVVAATGLSHIHKIALTAALLAEMPRRVLFVTADEVEAERAAADFAAFGLRVLSYPARDFDFRSAEGRSREYEHRRLGVLTRAARGDFDVLILTVEAAAQRTLPPDVLAERTLTLRPGMSISPDALARRLTAAGYVRTEQVDGPGTFAVRGGILDFFAPESDRPVRVDFWGDEIDTLAAFDVLTQRRDEHLTETTLCPAREILLESEEAARILRETAARQKPKSRAGQTLAEDLRRAEEGLPLPAPDRYLAVCYDRPALPVDHVPDALVIFSETAKIRDRLRTLTKQKAEDVSALLEEGLLCPECAGYLADPDEFLHEYGKRELLFLETFARGGYELPVRDTVHFSLRQIAPFRGTVEMLCEDLRPALEAGRTAVVLTPSARNGERLAEDLRAKELPALYAPAPSELPKNQVLVTTGALSAGFDWPAAKILVIASGQVPVKPAKKRKNAGQALHSPYELKTGDYVVHSAHGIGIFEGIHKIESAGITKDYIKIRYAKSDVLYVPVTQSDLLSKYIGPEENGAVRLHRLGGAEWQRTKSNVRKAVQDMAKRLTELYAKRMNTKGHAFSPDTEIQFDFERRFEFEETDDQLRCADEIKRDMERAVPMDRLLCGDVGFGKTEVALRAAFKCVTDGKQCAVLVPTTLLAWQHYQTILRRMEPFAVNAELLSRFRSPKEREEVLRRLARGDVDIVVGTHRLISKDVRFRDLGLVIVDEEQRFGVAQKERLKELFPGVDVLTLSATPIPRTLNMAMSGLRDMSVIEEAPQDRHPVQTYVMEYDEGVILDALRRELRRGGQAYYLHNRTESIERTAFRLSERLPDARIGTAHGKMSEDELSAVWKRLLDHEIDILVCTTIIETGVDVPNANTLIIENCDRFGLAQLHQLRGRVGRSARRAYAYLTFRRGKALSETAAKRLEAIREFTEFGAGFKIAMRDLEIRGAGNILGGEQHGHTEAVGYDMYLRMLADAVAEESGKKTAPDFECTVDLQIDAHIPEKYIASLNHRLEIYRRIADIRNDDDASDVIDELLDRFGDPPAAVRGLIDAALLRNRAASHLIAEVTEKNESLLLYPAKLDPNAVSRLSAKLRGRVMVGATARPYIAVRKIKGQNTLAAFKEIMDVLDGKA